MDRERDAQKFNIFVNETFYLTTKWALKKTYHTFIRLKCIEGASVSMVVILTYKIRYVYEFNQWSFQCIRNEQRMNIRLYFKNRIS